MTPLTLQEGWHVLHLFYHVDYTQWSLLSDDEQRQSKVRFTELIQEIRATPDTQLLTFSIVSPKADLGFMLLTPDLHVANAFEKQLSLSLGAEILTPAYSYFSLTEPSEYTTTREQYIAETLVAEKNLTADSEEYANALKEFDERMAHYRSYRVYPQLPDWPVVCFYPMTKRRSGADNWYALDYETRRNLMSGHARVGRTYSGKILQLITGSTGLDEYEWGVTLIAHNLDAVKEIIYEMRFDEVSARYGEFGPFYINLRLQPGDLWEHLRL